MYSKNPFNFSGESEDLVYGLFGDRSETNVRNAIKSVTFKYAAISVVSFVGGILVRLIIKRKTKI